MAKRKVTIVGGGIIGLSSAYALWKDGAEITLLEKKDIGAGSSLENAGLVAPSHFIPLASPGVVLQGLRWMFNPESPFYIKPRLDPDLLSWLWKFRAASRKDRMEAAMPLLRDMEQASLRLYEAMAREERLEFGLQKRGILMLFNSERGRTSCTHEAELAEELGIDARLMTRMDLERLDPGMSFAATGGVYYPGDAHLCPELFVQTLARFLASKGVQIRTRTEVFGFEAENSRILSVRTSQGTLEVDTCVLSGGAWSPGLLEGLGINLPLQAGKGYSITFPHPTLCPTIPSILTEARVAVTPLDGRLRLAGTMELAGLDESVTMRRVEAILRAIPRYYRGWEKGSIGGLRPWAGLRPCTPDGLPYVGKFSHLENLVVATGHAMIGVTLAPITGSLVADAIAGRPSTIDTSALSPERFS